MATSRLERIGTIFTRVIPIIMSKINKGQKSKFLLEDLSDFLNDSQFLKDSPKTKKPLKRQRAEAVEGNAPTIVHPTSNKIKKSDGNYDVCGDSRRKLFDVICRQLESRKQSNDGLLKNLSEVLTSMEADQNALKENQQKLEHLTSAFMKCIQQTTSAHKQKLKALNDIHASFQKECQEMESEHKAETDRLGNELEEDIKKLQQKLISETKRSGWETLKRTIFQAMQNDF